MRGYGLPRNTDVGAPDCADIKEYGLASHKARLPGKGGDIRSVFKDPADKARARRRFARKARAENKAVCETSRCE